MTSAICMNINILQYMYIYSVYNQVFIAAFILALNHKLDKNNSEYVLNFYWGITVYRDMISLNVLVLRELGTLRKLEQKWWYDMGKCGGRPDSKKVLCDTTFIEHFPNLLTHTIYLCSAFDKLDSLYTYI